MPRETHCPFCHRRLALAATTHCSFIGCGKRLNIPAQVAPLKTPTHDDRRQYENWLASKEARASL